VAKEISGRWLRAACRCGVVAFPARGTMDSLAEAIGLVASVDPSSRRVGERQLSESSVRRIALKSSLYRANARWLRKM
jgi:hypothetical protein